MFSVSPVSADSEILTSFPRIKSPSQGKAFPYLNSMMSPTTISAAFTSNLSDSRMTVYLTRGKHKNKYYNIILLTIMHMMILIWSDKLALYGA